MKKYCLGVLGLLLSCFSLLGQDSINNPAYQSRKLKFEEANLVSSYYSQDGNNSAVTGGIGTEKLTDVSNHFDVRFTRYDHKQRKQRFTLETGVDYYTSASSDNVNPATITSASYSDLRVYPAISYSQENERKGTTVGGSLSTSFEYDYNSFGGNIFASKKFAASNTILSGKLQVYRDQLKLIYPIELRNNTRKDAYTPRNSYSSSISLEKIVNERMQVSLIADLVYQQGYLGLPFHRVYFSNNVETVENLPDTRLKIPIGARLNYFAGDKTIFRTYYRFYSDNWGLKGHTADVEVSYKLSPFTSITPFYRFYSQQATRYFGAYKTISPSQQYFTSNYDLSTFTSHFFGAGIRFVPLNGVFGIQKLHSAELRFGHYSRSTPLNSNIISLHLQYK